MSIIDHLPASQFATIISVTASWKSQPTFILAAIQAVSTLKAPFSHKGAFAIDAVFICSNVQHNDE